MGPYIKSFAICVALSLSTNTVLVAQSMVALPQAIYLPWHFIGVLPETMRTSREALTNESTAFMAKVLENAVRLDRYVTQHKDLKPLLLNQRRFAESIYVGKTKLNAKTSLSFQPILCSLGKYYAAYFTVTDMLLQNLLFTDHFVVDKKLWHEAFSDEDKGFPEYLSEALLPFWERVFAGIQNIKTPLNDDAIQVGIHGRYLQNRRDKASTLCLNTVLRAKLVDDGYKVLGRGGLEMQQFLHDLFLLHQRTYRSTRHFQIYWGLSPAQQQEEFAFPQSYSVRTKVEDAVLARHGDVFPLKPWTLSLDEAGRLALDGAEAFYELIEREKSLLIKKDLPKVVKIFGAWAYLDRGRAWGLRMRDRMVLQGSGRGVRGHVVKFYGPEDHIKDLNGNPVYEGAILYIRNGQAQVRIGQLYDYDKMKFPAPIP